MKKHLATIIGILLTLGVAFGAFAWDITNRDNSSHHRARMLTSVCYEERRAATGTPVSQEFPECSRFDDEHYAGYSSRVTSSAMVGAAAGAGFALLFFGGLWLLRRRRAQMAAGGGR